MMHSWFERGWNVGIFYWDQFADAPCERDAEQKIWFDRSGRGLAWKSYDAASGSSETRHLQNATSMVDLCSASLASALRGFSGAQLRFVGFSLGAQLAAGCASQLLASGADVKPTRLSLLDPLFTHRHLKIFRCGADPTGFTSRQSVGHLAPQSTSKAVEAVRRHHVATDVYKTSPYSEPDMAGIGYTSMLLDHLALVVKYVPDWCDAIYRKYSLSYDENLECRHHAAIPLYFMSHADPSPPLVGTQFSNIPGACLTPTAACSDEEVHSLARTKEAARDSSQADVYWVQVEGRDTASTSDDRFKPETRHISDDEMLKLPFPTADTSGALHTMGPIPITMARSTKNDNEVSGDVGAKVRRVPFPQRLLIIALGCVGMGMLCYGLQPWLGNCACMGRSNDGAPDDSDSEGSASDAP